MESEVLLLNYLLLLALSSTRDKKEILEIWDKYKAHFTFPLIQANVLKILTFIGMESKEKDI